MHGLQRPGRPLVLAPNGMASTSQPLSTQAAVNSLQNGDNAMDVTIAAYAVHAIVEVEEPFSYETHDGLRDLAHNIQSAVKPIDGSQAIFVDCSTHLIQATVDPRKNDCAFSY